MGLVNSIGLPLFIVVGWLNSNGFGLVTIGLHRVRLVGLGLE